MLLAATRARTVPETDSRVFVWEEDTQDGYEDEAAARAHEDAEDARSEAYEREYQPLDCLLPTERGQPLY